MRRFAVYRMPQLRFRKCGHTARCMTSCAYSVTSGPDCVRALGCTAYGARRGFCDRRRGVVGHRSREASTSANARSPAPSLPSARRRCRHAGPAFWGPWRHCPRAVPGAGPDARRDRHDRCGAPPTYKRRLQRSRIRYQTKPATEHRRRRLVMSPHQEWCQQSLSTAVPQLIGSRSCKRWFAEG